MISCSANVNRRYIPRHVSHLHIIAFSYIDSREVAQQKICKAMVPDGGLLVEENALSCPNVKASESKRIPTRLHGAGHRRYVIHPHDREKYDSNKNNLYFGFIDL